MTKYKVSNLIDHHRTGTVHRVKDVVMAVGTKTECGLTLPHSPATSDVTGGKVTCGNCKKLTEKE